MITVKKQWLHNLCYLLLLSIAPGTLAEDKEPTNALRSSTTRSRSKKEVKPSTEEQMAKALAEEDDDEDDDDEEESLDSQEIHSNAHFKALAVRAEELIKNNNYNAAIPLIVSLLKRTGSKDMAIHTAEPLDEMLTKALVFDAVVLNCGKAKSQFKRLTASNTNAYAQAQGNVWLGTLRYLQRGCVKNRRKAKKHFRRALSLNSNKRASAEARLALGIIYSFQKNPFSKKALYDRSFQRHMALLRAQGMDFLKQAESQTDSKMVARYAKNLREAINKDIKKAYLDFKLKAGTLKKL